VTTDADPLTTALRDLGLARDRLWAALARSSGLGTTDLTAIELLDVRGEMTQRDLGRRLGLTSGAVTMLVDRLQRTEWLERYPNFADRRCVLVDLARGTRQAMPQGLSDYYHAMQILVRAVPSNERAVLVQFLADAAFSTEALANDYA
jgi:DNA-binding MarR family transcriptional regulator